MNHKPLGAFTVLAAIHKHRHRSRVYSLYLADDLRTAGYSFSPGVLLRRLRSLESSGFISTDGLTRGFYGLEWKLTDKGMEWEARS